jgi:hypothetical protein
MAQVTLAVNFVAFGPVMTVAVLFIKFVVFAVVIASLGVCLVAIVNTGGCSGYVWAAVWLVFVTVLALVVGASTVAVGFYHASCGVESCVRGLEGELSRKRLLGRPRKIACGRMVIQRCHGSRPGEGWEWGMLSGGGLWHQCVSTLMSYLWRV